MFTQSFPPADAFLEQVFQIEYKKHLQQFVIFIATVVAVVVAVSQFVYTKAAQWYRNGGKEQLLHVYQQSLKFSVQVYTWTLQEFVPMMQKMYQVTHQQLVILGVCVPV
jgi:hypothetical protein